ncbi:hypothetical protein G6F46_009275 [Rhizopus delemar]|uniref:Tc1-like transposase DDE domain-containing protein n=2 Tax=Rhizopus TaxID=4842 RepID=A0A9P6Z070_9FUNG|nr:hypothetical protein G6F36_012019 [Rhizopus arrhizus]KAG1451607.1 hypothetical protein G6F55_009103 [Rhizopus delemar]KAG1492048.1 hypothetical protein G6F54_009589 [Rhizopus delemar]KAG1511577.1 hypothetical protein G6F53_005834 [Rhizopus delemar]KAG1521409.1 hypothetical protein G6F52_006771 [Rhizopus delemar]
MSQENNTKSDAGQFKGRQHLKTPSNTAFNWQRSAEVSVKFVESRNPESGRSVGRPPKLIDAHSEYLSKTATILGAVSVLGTVSALGVVNVKVRIPKAIQSKKRKLEGNKEDKEAMDVAKRTVGTITGHYFNTIASTLNMMDQYEDFKDHYLIVDNAPIHEHKNIKFYVESRGYNCVHLPPYSLELNPMK